LFILKLIPTKHLSLLISVIFRTKFNLKHELYRSTLKENKYNRELVVQNTSTFSQSPNTVPNESRLYYLCLIKINLCIFVSDTSVAQHNEKNSRSKIPNSVHVIVNYNFT